MIKLSCHTSIMFSTFYLTVHKIVPNLYSNSPKGICQSRWKWKRFTIHLWHPRKYSYSRSCRWNYTGEQYLWYRRKTYSYTGRYRQWYWYGVWFGRQSDQNRYKGKSKSEISLWCIWKYYRYYRWRRKPQDRLCRKIDRNGTKATYVYNIYGNLTERRARKADGTELS